MSAVTIRASSLGALFDCPARWSATHLEGKHMPSTGRAALGTAVHVSTALYDGARLGGKPLTIDETAGAAVDALADPEIVWDEDNRSDATETAIALHVKYCTIIAPAQQYAAVELKCEPLTFVDLGITLTGTTDRVREVGGALGIADIKTGRAIVSPTGTIDTGEHAYQLGVYELLASSSIGRPINEPAQIIGMSTGKTERRIATVNIVGASELLLGDGETPGVLEYAAKLIKLGDFYGNPRSLSCHKNYCPIFNCCKFRR